MGDERPLPETYAAGVIILRRTSDGGAETLLLRSVETGEWGLPKGHAEVGETPRENAERELFEETGIAASALRYVDFERELRYLAHQRTKPRWKTVRYFAAWVEAATEVRLSSEHDALAWLPLLEAGQRFRHDALKTLMRELAETTAVGEC